MSDIIDGIVAWWDTDGEAILTSVKSLINNIKDDILYLFDVALKPLYEWLATECKNLWDNHLNPLWQKILSVIRPLIELIQTLWKNVLSPLIRYVGSEFITGIKNALQTVWEVVKPVVEYIIDTVGNIIDVCKGIVKFLTGVFSGDWKKAWEGIKDIFSAIWEQMKTIVKGVVNAIIGIINGFLRLCVGPINGFIAQLNRIGNSKLARRLKLDFTIGEVSAPQIPYLAKGGIVDRATPAIIGENGKEAVLPLENNTEWIDTLAEKLSANSPTKLTLNVDGKALGYAVINNINSITRQTGTLQLSLG